MSARVEFVKGHGTENDFILVPDPEGGYADTLHPQQVRRLTDRYAGIGADGLIRIVRTAVMPEFAGLARTAEWFMDYRNADGSLAEMCGNGVRVMARYLLESGWADGPTLRVATRGGVRTIRAEPDGQYTVEMGRPVPMGEPGTRVTVGMGERAWQAVAVAIPNPHAVVFLDPTDTGDPLHALGVLSHVPTLTPERVFPEGANVEFVVSRGERHVALRVWERGVGETRSCGTGVCAAAWAAMRRDGAVETAYTVDVPGGRLLVTERADREVLLTGPAELGVEGAFTV